MKQNFTFILVFIAMVMNLSVFATKWRVSNVPGVNANFSTAQAINDSPSVMDGDTAYFEGSGDHYGDLTLAKRLVIIGPGYFLVQNDSTQDNRMSAILNSLTLVPGSDFSIITGMTVNAMAPRSNNLVIKRNYIGGMDFGYNTPASNTQLIQNVIYSIFIRNGCYNLNISNNCITIGSAWQYSITMEPNTSASVYNNVIQNSLSVYNVEFRNNICTGHPNYGTGTFNFYGTNVMTNNLFFANISSSNGNISNVPMNTVFTYTGSTDGQYKLLAGSPAIGAGYGGVDCGMFGGPQPYVLSGLPTVPAIWRIDIDGASVVVKAKSH